MRNWIMNCKENTFDFIANLGVSISIIGTWILIIFKHIPSVCVAAAIICLVGIVIAGIGTQLNDFRAKEENNETT